MFVLRLAGLLAGITVAVLLVMFMFTGDRRHLRLALRVFTWIVGAALLVLVFMLAERLIVLV
jgi:hypothetical protein